MSSIRAVHRLRQKIRKSRSKRLSPRRSTRPTDMTPSADAGTKAKAEADVKNTRSDLPLMMTDQVAGYISYFSDRGRGVFERAYARSGRYRDMITCRR